MASACAVSRSRSCGAQRRKISPVRPFSWPTLRERLLDLVGVVHAFGIGAGLRYQRYAPGSRDEVRRRRYEDAFHHGEDYESVLTNLAEQAKAYESLADACAAHGIEIPPMPTNDAQ